VARVSPAAAVTLREVLRGTEPDEILLLDSAGKITIVLAYGIHDDERARTREIALRLIADALPPDLMAEHEMRRH
jgi:hypothetical protein